MVLPQAAQVARSRTAADLAQALQRVDPRWRLRVNRNRGTLLSLRWRGNVGTVSVHAELLADPAFCAALPAWVAHGGRRPQVAVDGAVRALAEQRFVRSSVEARSALGAWEPLGGPVDLGTCFARLHAAWFAHLDLPEVGWGRRVAPGRVLTHIRFGAYHPGRRPRVVLHPRLDQPWVARVFVEHVLFHELCHHAQARRPVPGETDHSPRFRDWERRYPHHDLARAWEQAYLPHLLGGTIPELSAAGGA